MVTFQLPAGPKNLKLLFPDVPFAQVEEYYVELKTGSSSLATTNHYTRGCCCNDETVRLFFVNHLGGIDAVNFKLLTEDKETKSTTWKKPLKIPLQKWDGGTQRSNIISTETATLQTSCYGESDQEWLMEMTDTPNAWMQWKGTQGQPDDYMPVVVKDGKFTKKKENERYIYVFEIEVEYSNGPITLRN